MQLVDRERQRLRARYRVDLTIGRILVRDLEKERPGVNRDLLTSNALDVLDADLDDADRGSRPERRAGLYTSINIIHLNRLCGNLWREDGWRESRVIIGRR